MGMKHLEFLSGQRIYGCKHCNAHFANIERMISRAFQGQHGKAYLFEDVVNIRTGEANERPMTTGLHIVRDIFCIKCDAQVGWKYDRAFENSQRYKEGKFILEREMIKNVE